MSSSTRFPDSPPLAPYASGALGVPIFVGERLAGSMGFPFVEPDAITAEVRTVARIAADLGGQALERAGLYELERSSREALDRILAVAPRFQQDATPEAVVVSICSEAKRAFGCDVVQIWAPVDDEHLEVTWRDPPSDVIPPGTRVGWDDFPGLLEEMRSFRTMFVPNAQESTRGVAHAPRHPARPVLVAAYPDRDRGQVRADPRDPVGADRARAGAVGGGRDAEVRGPGRPGDRAGGPPAGAGGDPRAAGRDGGARGGRDAQRGRCWRSCARA